jgi:hypothetical protein
MSHDLQLVDTIKTRFARKSSAQLQAISQTEEHDRWSPEATVAAEEVLRARRAGLAHEPEVPDEEDDPPEFHYDVEQVAVGALASLLTGSLVIPYTRRVEQREQPDLPVPFGQSMAWLAIATTDTEAVATKLGLRDAAPASWGDGIEAAHQGSVFVTPPVGDWTLAVGTPLFQTPDGTATTVPSLLERLGRHFEEVQYYCNHCDIELFVWGRASRGQVVRGFGWLGSQNRVLWDVGTPTDEERELGFRFDAGQPPRIEAGEAGEMTPFAEENLFQLACYWSIDPMTLDVEFQEPVPGLLGKLAS